MSCAAAAGAKESAGDAPVHFKDLEALPEPVLRYFRYCLQEGQRPIKFCALRQKGAFRCCSSRWLLPACCWLGSIC